MKAATVAAPDDISEQQYIERYFKIVDKKRELVAFKYNSAQKYLESSLAEGRDKGYRRFLILKARKQGASSLILAKFLIRCLTRKNRRAVVISHESGATQRLLGRVYEYKDNLLPPPPVETESTKEMSFPETKSSYYVGTAGSKAFGRGDDTTDLHVSELDWWENTAVLSGLIESCLEDSEVVIETTVNGMGSKFHRMWLLAKSGDNDFYPIFIPWYMSTEYSRPDLVTADFRLTEAEEAYRAKYGLDMAQMAWRRAKIRSMDRPELFPQEYPADDVEAFLSSGSAVFDTDILSEWYNAKNEYTDGVLEFDDNDTVTFVPQSGGWLRVYQHPGKDKQYCIGADVAEGIENEAADRDYSTCSVKDNQSWEQVACMRYRVDPDVHADRLNLVGRYYNTALMGVERNNDGKAVLAFLQRVYSYPNLYYAEILDEKTRKKTKKFGWDENEKTRGMLIALQQKSIRRRITLIRDKQTVNEHMTFLINRHGKAEAASNSHDDTTFADMICTMMCDLHPHYNVNTDWSQKQFDRSAQQRTWRDRQFRQREQRTRLLRRVVM